MVTPPPAETKPAETATTPGPGGAASTAPVEVQPATAVSSEASQSPAVQTGMPNPPDQVTAKVPGQELGLQPMEAPYVPISASQEVQLEDLLARYKANEVTPAEYHRQRTAILAQPRE